MHISIETLDTRCLIFTCKIPANLGKSQQIGKNGHGKRTIRQHCSPIFLPRRPSPLVAEEKVYDVLLRVKTI
jgi:hypothetical protein